MQRINCFILIAVLVAFSPSSRFSKSLKEHPGLVSYTFRNEFAKDVPGTLDMIKSLGVTNMEMSSLFGKTPAELRKLLDERGMRCTSYGVGYDPLMNKTDQIIQDAKTLGAEFVRLGSFPRKAPFDLAQAQKISGEFNTVGKKLREAGLTFVYHNHGFEFQPWKENTNPGREAAPLTYFDYMLQNTNPDDVSYEMDILWVFHPGQNPAELLQRYPKRFKLMHIKDLKKGVEGNLSGGTPPENDVTLGTGQIDIPAVLKAARKTSIKYFYIEDENPNARQQVPNSIAYLRSI
ncbi:sugar phosphate isomerase/epimerase family protein [Spirosoma montaniterrae]|uniref:Sugar phosphate isomerase n=1 Tax=Spirosoma montaniterrae TaxID=1178516 RepID=A0A1P9X3R0_9BACT|nr:sugar phosphate isomerase/epimerase [Spirosoma montaniterrae]AQG82238.1 sugar phosphate isomerase [Spirosoma montaniterrae]